MTCNSDHTHLVLIPSFNTGAMLLEKTVRSVLEQWPDVWVVIDGSTDGSDRGLESIRSNFPGLRIIRLGQNCGKGAAVLTGMKEALKAGGKFALVMDSDGQHPAGQIREFMELSLKNPDAMILGVPDFGADAPVLRVKGRNVGNGWANLETWWGGVRDSLFGFRVYPLRASVEILEKIRGGRRFDFDTQLVVRLYWRGVRPLNVPVRVQYLPVSEGGVSHFHYFRDNFLLFKTHASLFFGMLARMNKLWHLRRRR